MRRSLLFLIIPLFCLFLAGCGYSTSSLLPSHLKTIYVAPFENAIPYGTERSRNLYYPLLEVEVTNKIIDRYLFDGNLRIAKEQNADLILKGKLLNYERQALRYFDDSQDVQEYRLNVIVSLELYDTVKEKVKWNESSFIGETTYFTSGSLAISEEAAVDKAVTDLARRVVERTIEDW
ncbi:MAG: LptE family protein [Candidatus Omnitrophota bacterium]